MLNFGKLFSKWGNFVFIGSFFMGLKYVALEYVHATISQALARFLKRFKVFAHKGTFLENRVILAYLFDTIYIY